MLFSALPLLLLSLPLTIAVDDAPDHAIDRTPSCRLQEPEAAAFKGESTTALLHNLDVEAQRPSLLASGAECSGVCRLFCFDLELRYSDGESDIPHSWQVSVESVGTSPGWNGEEKSLLCGRCDQSFPVCSDCFIS
jgi:hypothetical protein